MNESLQKRILRFLYNDYENSYEELCYLFDECQKIKSALFLFLSGFSFTNIHDSQGSRGRLFL